MTIILSHPLRVGWLLLACWAPATLAASLTLQQSLTAAEGYSAELSANRHQVDALQNMADSAMQLPDPKLKFGIENVPVQGGNAQRFTREGMTMGRIGIMQDYVSSTKRQRKSDTLRAEARQTDAGSATLRARLQQQTAQAWLALALSRQTLRDASALVTESERQITTQHAAVAGGGVPASGVLDARLTLLSMQDRISEAQRDVAVAQARLTQLTGLSATDTAGAMPPLNVYRRTARCCDRPSGNIPRSFRPAVRRTSPGRARRNQRWRRYRTSASRCITANVPTSTRIWPG